MENTEFDVIVCGTGLSESALSGLLAAHGHRVLLLDRNEYFGAESASLNLTDLHRVCHIPYSLPFSPRLGDFTMYNIDLAPKLLIASGELTSILQHTVAERYDMAFTLVENSFVYSRKHIHKVPSSAKEALSSNLMGFLEKRRVAKFFAFCETCDPMQASALASLTAREWMASYHLDHHTIDVIGHAVGLYENDTYLNQPAVHLLHRVQLYHRSIHCFGRSPYLYPMHGIGELPAAFSRWCAVHGGTTVLRARDIAFKSHYPRTCSHHVAFCVEENPEATPKPFTARAKHVIADPSYFPSLCEVKSRIVRSLSVCAEPVLRDKAGGSCQIIFPAAELNRKHDVYVLQLSSEQGVVPPGHYLVLISSVLESGDAAREIEPVRSVLGMHSIQDFVRVCEFAVPHHRSNTPGIHITESLSSASHFESNADNIFTIFEKVHGAPYDPEKINGQIH